MVSYRFFCLIVSVTFGRYQYFIFMDFCGIVVALIKVGFIKLFICKKRNISEIEYSGSKYLDFPNLRNIINELCNTFRHSN